MTQLSARQAKELARNHFENKLDDMIGRHALWCPRVELVTPVHAVVRLNDGRVGEVWITVGVESDAVDYQLGWLEPGKREKKDASG